MVNGVWLNLTVCYGKQPIWFDDLYTPHSYAKLPKGTLRKIPQIAKSRCKISVNRMGVYCQFTVVGIPQTGGK